MYVINLGKILMDKVQLKRIFEVMKNILKNYETKAKIIKESINRTL